MKLLDSDFKFLQSKQIEDDDLPKVLLSHINPGCNQNDIIKPSQIIKNVLNFDCLDDGIKDQLSIRHDRAVVTSVSLSLKPNSIVETGTSDGLSSILFLYSLYINQKGLLYSIDLPHNKNWTESTTTDMTSPGNAIPNIFRKRFISIIEDAKIALPRVLLDVNPRIFIHDSLHTITHMLFEYSVARALMPPKSLIVSDDILWNSSFAKFCQATECPVYVSGSNPNYGFAIVDIVKDDLGIWGPTSIENYFREINQ